MAEWVRCSECGTRRARRGSGACKVCEPIVFARWREEQEQRLLAQYGPLAHMPTDRPLNSPWTAEERVWLRKTDRNCYPHMRWVATLEELEARIGALEACIRPLGVLRQHIMLRNQLMAVGFCDVCRRPERDGHAVDCAWGAVEAALAALRQPPAATGGEGV